jgi:hypothetical protein
VDGLCPADETHRGEAETPRTHDLFRCLLEELGASGKN